jgi:hypothetical protein
MLYSYGYFSDEEKLQNGEIQFQILSDHLPLILQHERDILTCADYFFCPLDFAYCSWAYVGGDGPLYLGYLLLGWRDRSLTGVCAACGGKVLVTSFGGSILSGSNGWSGICESCHSKQQGRWEHFNVARDFVTNLRQRYPREICEWEEYEGLVFSWGGNGLEPGRKKRLVRQPLANPVSLNVLIDDLKSGSIRIAKMPNVSLLNQEMKLKFSRKP